MKKLATTKRARAINTIYENIIYIYTYHHAKWIKINWTIARCRGFDVYFFDQSIADEDYARLLCNKCLIADKCLVYGLSQHFGMWGGLTENQRRHANLTISYKSCVMCQRDAYEVLYRHFTLSICDFCGIMCH